MLTPMKRSVLSAAIDLFLGRNDLDDTMRRLRKSIQRHRAEGGVRRTTAADVFMAALGGRRSVEVFFRSIGKRR